MRWVAYQVAALLPFSVARSDCCCPCSFQVGDPAGLCLRKQGTLAVSWRIPFLVRYPMCHIFHWLKTSLWNSEKWSTHCVVSRWKICFIVYKKISLFVITTCKPIQISVMLFSSSVAKNPMFLNAIRSSAYMLWFHTCRPWLLTSCVHQAQWELSCKHSLQVTALPAEHDPAVRMNTVHSQSQHVNNRNQFPAKIRSLTKEEIWILKSLSPEIFFFFLNNLFINHLLTIVTILSAGKNNEDLFTIKHVKRSQIVLWTLHLWSPPM